MHRLGNLRDKNKKIKPFLGNPAPNNSISTFLYDSEPTLGSRSFISGCISAVEKSLVQPTDFSQFILDTQDLMCLNAAPGEHYQLLGKIIEEFQISNVLEIGTFRGLGALSIANSLPVQGKTFTVDIVEWQAFDSVLNNNLMADLRIEQYLADFSDLKNLELFQTLINNVEMIFLDGPKDGKFEYEFLRILQSFGQTAVGLIFIDDIKFENMIPLWRSIKSPKLDLTSFGHWSGTGIIDSSNGLEIEFSCWGN